MGFVDHLLGKNKVETSCNNCAGCGVRCHAVTVQDKMSGPYGVRTADLGVIVRYHRGIPVLLADPISQCPVRKGELTAEQMSDQLEPLRKL